MVVAIELDYGCVVLADLPEERPAVDFTTTDLKVPACDSDLPGESCRTPLLEP